MRAVEVPCVLNIAAVKLRFKEYDEAIYECNKVLGLEVSVLLLLLIAQLALLQEELDYAPDWVTKARYRRGQAQNGKQNFEQALADLKVVQRLQPADAGVKKEIAALKIAAEEQRSKEKKMYSKMF